MTTAGVAANLTLRQKELITGLAVPVLALLLFAVGEAAVRGIDWMRYGPAANVDATSAFYVDEKLGLRLARPGAKLGRVKINSAGFRGPDVPVTAPAHTLRIAFLGSSTTFDANSPEGEDWAAQTVKHVSSSLPPGCAVDFVNGGLPGFTSREMTRLFDSKVRQFSPAVVVMLPGDVTADIARDLKARGVDPLADVGPSWLGKQSRLWEKIEKNLSVIRLTRGANDPRGKLDFDERKYAGLLRDRLEQLIGLVKAEGSIPVLVTITGRIRRDQTPAEQIKAAGTQLYYNRYTTISDLLDARDAYNRSIGSVADATESVFVGAEDEIPADAVHFSDSMHFAPPGSAMMGRRVAQALLGSQAIAERIRGLGGACAEWRGR